MLRPVSLPHDLLPIRDLLLATASYDNRGNNEALADTMTRLDKFWPILRLILVIAPGWRDLFRGYVWEEGGTPVGAIIYQRDGKSSSWYISIIGVLEAYRQRGVGASLMSAAIEAIRQEGGTRITAKVEDRNVAAQRLCRAQGLHQVMEEHIFEWAPGSLKVAVRPAELAVIRSWEEGERLYTLEQRITPSEIRAAFGIAEANYVTPVGNAIVARLLAWIQRLQYGAWYYQHAGQDVGHVSISHRTDSDRCNVRILFDPSHPEMTRALMHHVASEAVLLCPNASVRTIVPGWQNDLVMCLSELVGPSAVVYQWYALNLGGAENDSSEQDHHRG